MISEPDNHASILLMGQTPPPWHGQSVATQLLFDHDWPQHDVNRLRMAYSDEMEQVGRFSFKKITHLFSLIIEARRILKKNDQAILFYPPASANWLPFIRDFIFLSAVRPLAKSTIFIYHARGLAAFTQRSLIGRWMARKAYQGADVSLEVSEEEISPHQVFQAKHFSWCPCGVDVPDQVKPPRCEKGPITAIFVGSLQEGKGVMNVLKTASVLKSQGLAKSFRFRIIGKWFSEAFEIEVRSFLKENQLEDMVELTGELTGDDKWDAYFTADVFFFPTHYQSEATPIVLMEALGTGLPIITTQWAGIPAMLKGCDSAQVLPINSADLYADALLKLIDRKFDPSSIAVNSTAFYRKHFLPERFIERVSKAFDISAAT